MAHPDADRLSREAGELPSAGLHPAEVDALRAFDEDVIGFAMSGSGWDVLQSRIALAAQERWYHSSILWTHTRSGPPDSPDHWFWRLYRASAEHDPGAALRALRVPLLAIWGEHDTAAPPRENLPLMAEHLDRSACPDRTLRVISRGDHTLWQVEDSSDPSDFQSVRTYVPEYFDLLTTWIWDRVVTASPTA